MISSLRVRCYVVCFIIFGCPVVVAAQTNLRLGGGLSTPYNNVYAVLNTASVTTPTGMQQLLADGQPLGFHAMARLMLPLAENVGFTLAGTYHRFGNVRVNIVDPARPTAALGDMQISQTMIPVAAGLEYKLFRVLLGMYLSGELSYNVFLSSATEIPQSLQAAGVVVRDSYSRVGGSVGVGVDVMLFGVGVDVCLRYNHSNLIGKTSVEPNQTFISLTASVVLGNK